MGSDVLAMLPELIAFSGGMAALLAGSFLPRRRQWAARWLTLVVLAAAAVASAVGLLGPDQTVFSGTFTADTSTAVSRLVVLASAALVVVLSSGELGAHPRESESYALMLFASAGVMVLAGASDLMVLATGFLLASLPVYGLLGVVRRPGSAEATLKTYLMGALFGILMLLGVTLLYGLSGTTTYAALSGGVAAAPDVAVVAGTVLVLVGLMFEAGAVPAHFWVPDATEGASVTAATFVTTVPKVGALVAAYRLVSALPDDLGWSVLVAALAAVSMTLGNLAAYPQTDVRRLLGWSTVSQVGFLLVPVSVAGGADLALPSLLLYLGAYAATNIAAFAVTASVPERATITDYRGLGREHPVLAACLLVALLGLVGTPPAGVFVGKLTTATAAWDGGLAWLAVVVVVNSVVSLFYYLRWLAVVFRPATAPGVTGRGGLAGATVAAVVAALVSLVVGVAAGVR